MHSFLKTAIRALAWATSLGVAALLATNEFRRCRLSDDLAFAACLLSGLLVGRFSYGRRGHVAAEELKLATLKATMRTVQVIVNNFFNGLLLTEMEIKDLLPPHSLDALEEGVQETSEELKALADVQTVKEVPFAMGPLVSYRSKMQDFRPTPAAPRVADAERDRRRGKSSELIGNQR